LLRVYGIFIPRLRRRQEKQAFVALVLYQSLLDAAVAFNYIHDIVHDPVFQAQYHIQIPKAYIGIDQQDLFSFQRQPGTQICNGRRLAYAAFSGRDDDCFIH